MRLTKMHIAAMTLLLGAGTSPVVAQAPQRQAGGTNESYEEFRKKTRESFGSFREKAHEDYQSFRKDINQRYADWMEGKWTPSDVHDPIDIPEPEVKPVPPVVLPVKEDEPDVEPEPVEEKEIPTVVVVPEPVVLPLLEPQPQPIVPVAPPVTAPVVPMSVYYLGTTINLSPYQSWLSEGHKLSLADMPQAWTTMSDGRYEQLLAECLRERTDRNMCDWAYLCFLQTVTDRICGADTDASRLLTAYLFAQSGYKMRLGWGGGKAMMLFASDYLIYNTPYYFVGNDPERYYPFVKEKIDNVDICDIAFPEEHALSLRLDRLPIVGEEATEPRKLSSRRYSAFSLDMSVNKNMIDFFDTYPTSEINYDMMTRWGMYAQTPLTEMVAWQVEEKMRPLVADMSQLDVVKRLLNWVQTAFKYEYDEVVWGYDRAFFAEESLFYPYCDCEDRSILFSQLVRRLTDARVALILYPGHMATAVKFDSQDVKGDYITINGEKYTVCDPTFVNAGVGMTMTGMDNAQVTALVLQ